jgi:hypothetical protein
VPDLALTDPVLGSTMTLTASDGLPTAYAMSFLGVPMVGSLFDLGWFGTGCASGIDWSYPTTPMLDFVFPPSGSVTQVYPIPADPALLCIEVMCQVASVTPTLAIELSNSWLAVIGT